MLLLVFQSGDLVDQYQVLRLLGQGGVGEVWLARDQVLGRKVALKVLRADLAGADDQRSLSDLLAEAQANAAVVHPHVVTVYAVGSHRGAPYLALEFIDGVTLRERITARAPTTPEALRFARDIASAVTAAHATGVLHLDLKPDNVLLAQDGRLRVVDFGLARLRRPDDDDDRAGTSIAGTPAYMPPEVWRGERPTEAADAWAFGVLLCELLAGRKPYTHETAQALVAALYAPVETPVPTLPTDVPGDVRGLLPRLLAKDATRRPAFAEVERVLAAALGRSRAHTGQDNPYCGLHAFREDDAARYFGRDDEIEAFVARLERAPVLPVVGHSGAGKSSFVRAGVIPRLREREPCLVVELRPGPRPFLALSRALMAARARHATDKDLYPPIGAGGPSSASDDVTVSGSNHSAQTLSASLLTRSDVSDPQRALAATLQQTPERLYLELADLARTTGQRVLLFVDQLEEAATLVADEATTAAFLQALAGAADDPGEPVRVVFTLRDDFLGRLATVPSLRAAFTQVTVLRRPTLPMLVESIIGPLVPLGVAFDDGNLPLEMARAVEHEPAALPLLSFTCAALWDRRDVERQRLLRRVYGELGGVGGALAAHVDGVFASLSPAAQRAARQVLLGLVTEDRTRRRRSRRELVQQAGTEAAAVLDRFIDARLLTVERSARDGDTEVELAHEALVKEWARLQRFLDEERDLLAYLGELQQAADGWARRGRQPEEVWRGAALREALDRLERLMLPASEAVRMFLDAGRREQARRQLQRRAAIGGLALLGVLVALVSLVARQHALDAAATAQQARALAEREAAETALARGVPWLARAKLRTALELEDDPQARALWRRVQAEPLLFSTTLTSQALDAAFASDGTAWVMTADDRLTRFSPGSFAAHAQPAFRDATVSLVAFAVLGDRALVAERDRGLITIVGGGGDRPVTYDAHDGGVVDVVALPAQARFATAGHDGKVRVFDSDGASFGTPIAYERPLAALTLATDGATLLALGADGVLLEATVDGARSPAPSRELGEGARCLAPLPDGGLVVGFFAGSIAVLDATRRVVARHFVSERGVAAVATDVAGTQLAIRDGEGAVMLWHREITSSTWRPRARLEPGGPGAYGGLAFDQSGRLLLSTSLTGDVRVWRVDDEALADRPLPRANRQSVAISADGSRVAELGDSAAVIRATATGEAIAVLPVDPTVGTVNLDGRGERIVLGQLDRAIVVDLSDGRRSVLDLKGGRLADAAWLADGAVVTVSRDGTVQRFASDATASEATARPHDGANVVRASPDGGLIVVGAGRGVATVLDARSLAVRQTLSLGDDVAVTGVDFSGDGRRVAIAAATRVAVFGVDGARLRDVPGEYIEGVCTGFDARGRVIALRTERPVVVDVTTGAERPLVAVPPTGSCETSRDGILAMRLGDYVLPYDVAADAPVWFSRGVVEDVVVTHRLGPSWLPGSDRAALAVDAAADRVCVLRPDGAALHDRADGRRRARAAVSGAMLVWATPDGCLWLDESRLHRLRPEEGRPEGGIVDVIGAEVEAVGAHDGVVVVHGPQGTRLLLDGGVRVDRLLPAGEFVVDGYAVVAVRGRRAALVDAAGTVAVWSLDENAPPRVGHVRAGDVGALAIGPAGLAAVGYSSERVAVVDLDDDVLLVDEPVRGAVAVVAFGKDRGRHVLRVGTNLGEALRFDVELLVAERCALLADVWRAAPVAWEQGRPREASPPAHHPCAPHR